MGKNNWNTKKLYELGTFDKGAGISKEDILPQGLPCIRYAEIYTKYDFQAKEFSSYISAETAKTSKPITQGTLLFAGSGETAEDIGKSVAYMGNSIAYASGDTILFKFHNSKENVLFYSYYLNTIGRKQLNKLGAGQSIVHIYSKELAKVEVPCPSAAEQRKIVEVLETWDKAIGLTKQLIEQKELQKKYLMQQLLTGRTRLKGFTDKWENVRLKQLCSIQKGQQLNANTLTKNGKYACLNGGIIPSGYTTKWNTEANTISISEGGNSCGYVNWNDSRFWAGGHCYTLTNVKISTSFLYFVLKNKEGPIMNLRVGSGLPNIQRPSLEKLLLKIPSTQKEQQAIANVLSSCDKGIDLLKQKLAKLEEQKKGLMQVLLTGKVRLVK